MASKITESLPNAVESTSAAEGTSKEIKTSPENTELEINSRPICMIVLGMAGSGKTSFVKRLMQSASLQNMKPYTINLDPACQEVPYHTNIGKT